MSLRQAQERLWVVFGAKNALISGQDERGRFRLVVAYPSRENKDAASVGHPTFVGVGPVHLRTQRAGASWTAQDDSFAAKQSFGQDR